MHRSIIKSYYLIFTLSCALIINSCGFQVIYKDQYKEKSFSNELASIRIKKNRKQLDQQLKNNIYDTLNPDYIKVEPKYFLETTLTTNTFSTFITSTGASGRNRVNLVVSYKLKNLKTMELISEGTTSMSDNYDVSTNRYGTLVADDYIKNNLTKIIAQNIRNSIVNDIIEMRKKCENPPDGDFVCPLEDTK